MKQAYITPQTEIISLRTVLLASLSGISSTPDKTNTINDNDYVLSRRSSIWDDEENSVWED